MAGCSSGSSASTSPLIRRDTGPSHTLHCSLRREYRIVDPSDQNTACPADAAGDNHGEDILYIIEGEKHCTMVESVRCELQRKD